MLASDQRTSALDGGPVEIVENQRQDDPPLTPVIISVAPSPHAGHAQTPDGPRPDRNWRRALAPGLPVPAGSRGRGSATVAASQNCGLRATATSAK